MQSLIVAPLSSRNCWHLHLLTNYTIYSADVNVIVHKMRSLLSNQPTVNYCIFPHISRPPNLEDEKTPKILDPSISRSLSLTSRDRHAFNMRYMQCSRLHLDCSSDCWYHCISTLSNFTNKCDVTLYWTRVQRLSTAHSMDYECSRLLKKQLLTPCVILRRCIHFIVK